MGQVPGLSRSPEDCRRIRRGVSGHRGSRGDLREAHGAKGADVSAFVDEAKTPEGTFFLPISEHASDVVRILRANFDAIFLEGADVRPLRPLTKK